MKIYSQVRLGVTPEINALAALGGFAIAKRLNSSMATKHIAGQLAEDALALAVNDSDTREPSEDRVIQEPIEKDFRVLGSHATQTELERCRLSLLEAEARLGLRSLCRSGRYRNQLVDRQSHLKDSYLNLYFAITWIG